MHSYNIYINLDIILDWKTHPFGEKGEMSIIKIHNYDFKTDIVKSDICNLNYIQ